MTQQPVNDDSGFFGAFGRTLERAGETAAQLLTLDFLSDRGLLPNQAAVAPERQVQTQVTNDDIAGPRGPVVSSEAIVIGAVVVAAIVGAAILLRG